MAVYAHELSHNLSIPDNYNNPFTAPFQRTASGMWDMMSRGSFNGPGGQHTRWQIPPTQGSALGAQHNMRNKRFLNFIGDNDLLRLNRSGLAQTGLAVAEVKAREVAPNGDLAGVRVNLDTDGDRNKICLNSQAGVDLTCEGPWRQTPTSTIQGRFNDYTMEVVQQIGSDSFTPGHGVLLGKSKTGGSTCGSYNCFVWYIDSNPQDIDQVDFVRPDGTVQKATPGDERQLNDGTFNAGVNSGGEYEYVADANKLHFYILDKRTDAQGVLHYKVGIRSLEGGAGPQTRGVSLATPVSGTSNGLATCTFPLTNTGTAADVPTGAHPTADAAKYFGSDIYRLSATASGTGWSAHLQNVLATAKFGETVQVPVFIDKAAGAAASGSVTLTATSESDPTKSVSAVCTTTDGNVGGNVPATLVADHGQRGAVPAVHARRADGLLRHHDGERDLVGGRRRAERRRPGDDQHRQARQRRVRAARDAAGQRGARHHVGRHLQPGRRVGEPDHAVQLGRSGIQRHADGRLQAADQGQRRVAHGHVQQDADVHPVDDEPVT